MNFQNPKHSSYGVCERKYANQYQKEELFEISLFVNYFQFLLLVASSWIAKVFFIGVK